MVRNYVRKTQRQSWDTQKMAKAIQAVAEGRMGYRKASKVFSVPRTSLQRRVKMFKVTPDTESLLKKGLGKFTPTFNPEQEAELVAFLINMNNRLDGLTTRELRALVFHFAEKNKITHSFSNGMAGVDWFERFRSRNPNLLIHKPDPALVQAKDCDRVKDESICDLFETTLDTYDIEPHTIFNMDETNPVMVCGEQDQ